MYLYKNVQNLTYIPNEVHYVIVMRPCNNLKKTNTVMFTTRKTSITPTVKAKIYYLLSVISSTILNIIASLLKIADFGIYYFYDNALFSVK